MSSTAASQLTSFDPVIRLTTLLGPKPNHPWGALLPQALLWAFRRFCVERLVGASDTPLTDQMWDDHLELIHKYAPKGLESASADWFTPENIDFLHSSLESYDQFFVLCLGLTDDALASDNEEEQDMISDFLDNGIGRILREWLTGELDPFLIFPQAYDEDDVYPEAKFMALIRALIQYSHDHPALEGNGGAEASYPDLVEFVVAKAVAEEVPSPPSPVDPPPVTVAAAIVHRRRHTFCSRPRDRSTRGKTRRLHPRA